jgi:hypothetical protein
LTVSAGWCKVCDLSNTNPFLEEVLINTLGAIATAVALVLSPVAPAATPVAPVSAVSQEVEGLVVWKEYKSATPSTADVYALPIGPECWMLRIEPASLWSRGMYICVTPDVYRSTAPLSWYKGTPLRILPNSVPGF